MTQQSYLLC